MIDIELESQVLAAMLNDKKYIDIGMAALDGECFSNKVYRRIFEHMKVMYAASKPIDAITVYEDLKDIVKGHGVSWMSLKECHWLGGTFEYCVERLQKLSKSRKLANLSQDIIKRLCDKEDIDGVLRDMENGLYSIATNTEITPIVTPKRHAEEMLETLYSRIENQSNGGIKTSYSKLNYAMNGGFLPGQLMILAAQTGKGKTTFALNLMKDVAIVQKQPALYINTEMSEEQIACRWMTILTKNPAITHSKIATGHLTQEEQREVIRTMNQMYGSGFYSATVPELTIDTLISLARRFKAQCSVKFLVVDYVGRMDTQDRRLKEYQVLKLIAKRLKTLAQELQVTVIMLAQITEDEKLEGAKAMKNECDLFGYLRDMSESELNRMKAKGMPYNYYLCLDKNRDGQRIKIPLQFVGEKMIFRGERQLAG